MGIFLVDALRFKMLIDQRKSLNLEIKCVMYRDLDEDTVIGVSPKNALRF